MQLLEALYWYEDLSVPQHFFLIDKVWCMNGNLRSAPIHGQPRLLALCTELVKQLSGSDIIL